VLGRGPIVHAFPSDAGAEDCQPPPGRDSCRRREGGGASGKGVRAAASKGVERAQKTDWAPRMLGATCGWGARELRFSLLIHHTVSVRIAVGAANITR